MPLHCSCRDSSSDEMEKLRSVAVSYEWVVSQSRGFCNAEGGLVTVDRDSFSNSTSKKCLDNIVSEFKKASLVRRNRNNRKKRLKN